MTPRFVPAGLTAALRLAHRHQHGDPSSQRREVSDRDSTNRAVKTKSASRVEWLVSLCVCGLLQNTAESRSMSNKDADPILLELVVRVLGCDVDPEKVTSLRDIDR